MKAIIILDQIQAGLGGKERADTPFGGKKIAMGSADNVEKALKSVDGKIIGTFYCGTEYYTQHRDLVKSKFSKMAVKMDVDVVITGPTFDYPEFTKMAAEIADYIQNNSEIPVIQASAIEKNKETIDQYKEKFPIVKMPKKGGTNLPQALDNLANGCQILTKKGNLKDFKKITVIN